MSVKDSVLLVVSYFTYFALYVSVYVADAMYLLTWTLIYVFSPLLISAFTLPATATATAGLFRSLIEVCLWKIAWSVLAALLWSYALSEINQPQYDVDFLTAIILNLMLAFSVLLTPFVVRALIKGGVSSSASNMGMAVLSALALTPTQLLSSGKQSVSRFGSKLKGMRGESEDDEEPPYRRGLKSKKKGDL